MNGFVGEKLRRDFLEASLKRQMRGIDHGLHRERFSRIANRAHAATLRENKQYREFYQGRVSQEILRVQREAGRPRDELNMVGEDRFNPNAIRVIAEKRVRNRHERRLGRIGKWRDGQFRQLKQDVRQASKEKGKAERSFNKSVDRRSGGERRASSRTRER